MRTLIKIVFIGLFLVSGTAPSSAGEEEKQALILEVLHLTGVLEMFETMKSTAGNQFEVNMKAQGLPVTDEQIAAVKEIMLDVFDEIKPDMVVVIINIYNDNYNEDELSQLVAFYKTDLGQIILSKEPQIATQIFEQTNALVISIQPELRRRITKKFEEMAKENKS